MMDEALRVEVNKRLTLNWLIQGASQHAGMTLHHLVRDELDALDPRLIRLNDQIALVGLMQYWHVDAVLIMGRPARFWKRAATDRNHPFFDHPLLSRYGGMLAESARQRGLDRSKSKGVSRIPILFSNQAMYRILRVKALEKPHRRRLVEIATTTASSVWGFPLVRLQGEIVDRVVLGPLIPARTMRGKIMRAMIVGYSHVARWGEDLVVRAWGTNWHLLTKELVKGIAELICLHGLNELDDETYGRVMDAADRVEYEPWMLQTGGELWRRLLEAMPADRPVAEVMMHLAKLPADPLHTLVAAVIDRPQSARELLAGLGEGAQDA